MDMKTTGPECGKRQHKTLVLGKTQLALGFANLAFLSPSFIGGRRMVVVIHLLLLLYSVKWGRPCGTCYGFSPTGTCHQEGNGRDLGIQSLLLNDESLKSRNRILQELPRPEAEPFRDHSVASVPLSSTISMVRHCFVPPEGLTPLTERCA